MERLGREVERELRRLGPEAAVEGLVAAWPDAVGEGIARVAWPVRIARDGTAVVHTTDSVWAFELTQRAEEIRARLGAAAPRRLRFVPGPLPEPSPAAVSPAGTPVRALTHEQAGNAASWADAIEDEQLRELAARAARASLARAADNRPFC